jgi:nucleotide-binding universal stress UspA family protein
MTTATGGLILCPVDFSESSRNALRWAVELARRSGSPLAVLYADRFLPPPHFTAGQIDSLLEELGKSRQAARESLAALVRDLVPAGVPAELLVEEDLAVPAIVRVAHDRNAGLVVMGSHGHSGFERVMLGSVTEKVLRLTDRPVLVVKGESGAAASALPDVRSILCPVDLGDASRHALDLAARLAAGYNARLEVLHVVEKAGPEADLLAAHERLMGWIPQELRGRCTLREIVRGGNAAEEILAAARESGSELVVLATRHKTFWDATVLGSTAARIVRHATCPVLAVPLP